MVIDLKKCVGCQACTVACNSEWEVPVGMARTHVRATEAVGTFPHLQSTFYVAQCNHCDHPACVPPCPSGATYQAENGIVKVDRDLCIGCGYCVDACPYGARYIQPVLKKVDKCDFCAARLSAGSHLPASRPARDTPSSSATLKTGQATSSKWSMSVGHVGSKPRMCR